MAGEAGPAVSALLRKGARFVHRRHLKPDYRTPAVCVVTAVRNGTVYYHDEPDGMRCKAPIAPREHTRYQGFEAEEVAKWL